MSTNLIGVIPAAGKGIRLLPHTDVVQKCMLNIDGKPILEQTIEIMRDQLNISDFYVLVGYKKEQIQEYFNHGEKLGVHLKYVEIEDVEKGLARGILQLEKRINGPFCVMLGDEVYHNTNHRQLLGFLNRDFSAVCAIKEGAHPYTIRKNYSVELDGTRIVSLIEKPEKITNTYLGCGTYLLTPSFFEYIKKTPVSLRSKRVEFTDALAQLALQKKDMYAFPLKGDYININTVDDYNTAQYMLRSTYFSRKKVSVIIPAYNEEASLGYVLDDFKGKADEIVVVDNTSKDRTAEIAHAKGARVLTGRYKGYGDALKHGMDNANGDILVLVEADGSFLSRDLSKILEYMKDADMVLGTRTTKQMIEQAANMNSLLRWGNVCVAKLIELLWLFKHEPRLTDVGCTYRAVWKTVYMEMRDSLQGKGPEFSPEMMIEAIRHNKRVIEIPITYTGRIGGESKFSKGLLASARTAMKMLKLIFRKWIQDVFM